MACHFCYIERDGEPVDKSNDPVQWLKEQAFRTDLQPPPTSVHDYEYEDAGSDDDSVVSIRLSERLILLKS